jgi:hypothetical protein
VTGARVASVIVVAPVPLNELNTADAEVPTWLSPDNCRLYFHSTRAGNESFYLAERTP